MLIALGLEPEHMDTTVLTTPEASGVPVPDPDLDDSVIALLAARPDLAAPWQHMARCLDTLPGVDADLLAAGRRRLAELIGVAELAPPETAAAAEHPHHDAVMELAELFAIDVRAIDQQRRDHLRDALGEAGLVAHIMNLAVYDGIWRVAACRQGAPV